MGITGGGEQSHYGGAGLVTEAGSHNVLAVKLWAEDNVEKRVSVGDGDRVAVGLVDMLAVPLPLRAWMHSQNDS